MPDSDRPLSREQLLSELAAARRRVEDLERALAQHHSHSPDDHDHDHHDDGATHQPAGLAEPDDTTFTRTLLTHLPDYVYFKDRERRFLRISDSFEGLLGRPAAEIIGRCDEDLFPPEIASETAQDDRRVIEQGVPLVNKLEGGVVSPGVERWVLTTKLPWRDSDGEVLGLFGLSRDVTAQKKLEDEVRENERRLRVITDTLPFPVGATSLVDDTVVYANRALAEFLDLPMERLIGSRMADYYADSRERDQLVAQVREGERIEGLELRLRRHDGTIRIGAGSAVPLTIDGVPTLMGALADITDLKAREAELRDLGAEKDLLLREVNHRVRNNLATLSALISQQLATAQGETREAIERIGCSVRGLAAVHAMLSASGWHPIEVATLCRDVVRATLRELDPAPYLHVAPSTQRVASQPAHQLALVIAELATNTMKHGRIASPLRIAVTVEPSATGVRITYRDNGAGYPEAVLRGDGHGAGLRLIDGLVSYGLSGRLSLSNQDGAVAALHLPPLDATVDAAGDPHAATQGTT